MTPRVKYKADREQATIWVSGLDRIHAACGIRLCVDLSATPFYLYGSGYPEGSPDDTDVKHQAARRWVAAVNHWGRLGEWAFLVCRDPQRLDADFAKLVDARTAREGPKQHAPLRR